MKILKLKTERRELGNLGERRAALYLLLRGYRILERNYVSGDAEIDIIAKRGDVYSFVEVKTRTEGHTSPREPRPASAVTPEKQRKIIKCARDYRYKHPFSAKMRFDVIEVLVREGSKKPKIHKINHLISAFDADSAR
jgi:putative endonuclease